MHRTARALLLALALAATVAIWTGTASATTEVFTTGPSVNTGVAIDDAGNVFALDYMNAQMLKFQPDGSAVGGAWPAFVESAPSQIAMDAAGNLFVASAGGGQITKVTPAGAASVFATIEVPQGIAIAHDGTIYVTSSTTDVVHRYRADGTEVSTGNWPVDVDASTGLSALAIGPDGSIYAGNGTNNRLWKISPDGVAAGGRWPVTLIGGPESIAVASDGSIYAVNYGGGGVSKVLPDGTVVVTGGWPAVPAESTRGIALDAAGNVYTDIGAGYLTDHLVRIAPDGSVTDLGASGSLASQIVIDANGSLYAANQLSGGITKATQEGDYHAPPAVPSAPSAVAGSGTGSATVTITPNAVSARFGAPTSYTVAAVRDATKHCTITAPATSCTVTGLTGGTSYTFTATATLQAWTTAASSASLPVTPKANPPAKPTVTWSKDKRTVTALITPVTGVTYALTAKQGATTKTGTCRAVTVKGKARRRCTITLPNGTWSLAVTPTRNGTAGTKATKTYAIR